MKVRGLTSLSVAVSSFFISFDRTTRAWVSQPKHENPFATRYNSHVLQTGRIISTKTKAAAITVDDDTLIRQQSESSLKSFESTLGRTIAEGTVVSHVPGGLTAIRISEEFTDDEKSTITLTSDGLKVPTNTLTVKVEVGDYQGKQVVFSDGSIGVIVAHRPPLVFVYSNSLQPFIEKGNVKVKETVATVAVNPSTRVVDCFGQPIGESENAINEDMLSENPQLERSIFSPIPQVKDIALINNPALTGITMIDTLASIGRGQNMLLVGHNLHSMRKLVEDYLDTQTKTGKSMCIYATTQESSEETLKSLKGLEMLKHVQLVAPRNQQEGQIDDASKAAEAVIIAATACAIGESYAMEGKHALVIIDTIDLHKKFWDYTTRVMVDVFGIDSVVKSDREGGASSEMRGFFSALVQRSAQFNENRGGGSVTLLLLVSIPAEDQGDEDTLFSAVDFESSPEKVKARIDLLVQKKIPLTASTLRKINIPIPSASEGQKRYVFQHVDDLISMSDGQIWLDERLEASGREPPVDPQRSVTRIGIGADTNSRADAPALRRIVEGLRLELSQLTDVLPGVDLSRATQIQNRRQQALLLAMHQKPGSGGRRLSESCAVLLAAQNGYLDKFVEQGALAGTEKGRLLISGLLDHIQREAGSVMDQIDEIFDMTDAEQKALQEAIRNFLK